MTDRFYASENADGTFNIIDSTTKRPREKNVRSDRVDNRVRRLNSDAMQRTRRQERLRHPRRS